MSLKAIWFHSCRAQDIINRFMMNWSTPCLSTFFTFISAFTSSVMPALTINFTSYQWFYYWMYIHGNLQHICIECCIDRFYITTKTSTVALFAYFLSYILWESCQCYSTSLSWLRLLASLNPASWTSSHQFIIDISFQAGWH